MKSLYRVHSALDRLQGMYRASNLASDYMSGEARHPAPYQDRPFWAAWDKHGEDRNKFFFGFATLDKFTTWVYADWWWERLQEEGCVISLWKLPEHRFIEGYTQAAGMITGINPVKTVTVPEWHMLREYDHDTAVTTAVHPVNNAAYHDSAVYGTGIPAWHVYAAKAWRS